MGILLCADCRPGHRCNSNKRSTEMAKRKAEGSSQASGSTGSKKLKASTNVADQTSNLWDDSDSGSDSDGGVKVESLEFKINQDYAKRFEHNKKREELHRLEEKYQDSARKLKSQYGDKYDEDSESSDDEEEDDEGILATEELDAQISDALNAIRSKDPRVYKTDYHREYLLKGNTNMEEEEADAPRTFAQEQEDLKNTIVKEMHAADVDESDDEADEDGGFLVPKSKHHTTNEGVHPSRAAKVKADLDIASADKNPETFLSNFMAARAWVPSDGARFQPLESDDDEEDERAEKFEEAYNLRFEDSKGSNEVLKSYARDVIAAKSVRREEPSGRKKQRDAVREKIEAGKKEREEERAQLRRLKIEEAEEKLKKIKKAAGIRGKTLKGEEWADFLDDGWDDGKWETEMNRQFGEENYAELEAKSDDEDVDAEARGKVSKKKIKKPKWDDDIDVKDIVPDFDEEDSKKPGFTLSDSDSSGDEADSASKESKTSKERQHQKQEKKKAARLERKKLEALVDSKMDLVIPTKSKQTTLFRYRETSPTTFGLTARDILMAPDASLNEFAGLKKMATFRDAEKKRKDKKKLGKKARLRQWRKETFGNEDGPEIILNADEPQVEADNGFDIVEGGKKKKKRSRKGKGVIQPA